MPCQAFYSTCEVTLDLWYLQNIIWRDGNISCTTMVGHLFLFIILVNYKGFFGNTKIFFTTEPLPCDNCLKYPTVTLLPKFATVAEWLRLWKTSKIGPVYEILLICFEMHFNIFIMSQLIRSASFPLRFFSLFFQEIRLPNNLYRLWIK